MVNSRGHARFHSSAEEENRPQPLQAIDAGTRGRDPSQEEQGMGGTGGNHVHIIVTY